MGIYHPKVNKKLVYMGRIIREKLLGRRNINWTWVRGHQGNAGNERADRLADQGREQWSMNSRASDGYPGRAIFLMGAGSVDSENLHCQKMDLGGDFSYSSGWNPDSVDGEDVFGLGTDLG